MDKPGVRLFRDDGSRYWHNWSETILDILESSYVEIAVILVFATICLTIHHEEDRR